MRYITKYLLFTLCLVSSLVINATTPQEALDIVANFNYYMSVWSRNPGDIEARDGLKVICNNGQNMRVADRLALEKCTTTDDNSILLGSYLRIFEDRKNEKIKYLIKNPKVENINTQYSTNNRGVVSVVADVEVKSVSLNYIMKNVFYIKDNKICFIDEYVKRTTKTSIETFTVNGVSFNMIYVEGGTFMMGYTTDQYDEDCPEHGVSKRYITLQNYYIGETEVTQGLWNAIRRSTIQTQAMKGEYRNSLCGIGQDHPMYYVNWYECQEFVNELNRLLSNQLNGRHFALPTEAQWEYAARGGNKSKHYRYAGSNELSNVAWFGQWNGQTYDNGNSGEHCHRVATKTPNELGIYDMSGNICEVCRDLEDSYCVSRGGAHGDHKCCCRVSDRSRVNPRWHSAYRGLRLVLNP